MLVGDERDPRRPRSVANELRAWALEIDGTLPRLAEGGLRDTNYSSAALLILSTEPYDWSDLPTTLRKEQSRVLEEYRRFTDMLRVLLRELPTQCLQQFTADADEVLRLIERRSSPFGTPEEALQNAKDALHRQIALIDGLFSGSETTLLVPDTNALYWNTALEDWRLPWTADVFTIVLTPAVTREIDNHKLDDRSSTRRAKAERLARQIGEYRRRGRLLEGVPLVKGTSTIMAIAPEPVLAQSLSWLDPTSPDDRLLASMLEIMRRNVRSQVIAVTRDINFQNRLEHARVPFVSPSDLVVESR